MPYKDQQKRVRHHRQQAEIHSSKREYSLVTQVKGSRYFFAFLFYWIEIEFAANRVRRFGLRFMVCAGE